MITATTEPAPYACGYEACNDWHCHRCGAHSSSQGHYGRPCRTFGDDAGPHFCCPNDCELDAKLREVREGTRGLLATARAKSTERLLGGAP